jgi:hypothetical protein
MALAFTGLEGEALSLLFPGWRRYVGDRQVPVRQQNFKAALFFFLIGILVRPELARHGVFVGIGGGGDG